MDKPFGIYYKVFMDGPNKTLFVDQSNPPKRVDDAIIKTCDLDLIPLNDVSNIYFGGGTGGSVQFKMESAILKEAHPKGRVFDQGQTLSRLHGDKTSQERLNEQLQMIRSSLFDLPTEEGNETHGPTNASIAPTSSYGSDETGTDPSQQFSSFQELGSGMKGSPPVGYGLQSVSQAQHNQHSQGTGSTPFSVPSFPPPGNKGSHIQSFTLRGS